MTICKINVDAPPDKLSGGSTNGMVIELGSNGLATKQFLEPNKLLSVTQQMQGFDMSLFPHPRGPPGPFVQTPSNRLRSPLGPVAITPQ